ncbi:helix-turn-helix domain-containing protein [Streptomyces sp. SAS_275]|uniref:helix-turn-helix domain-containing protein n=1 Tax=Streptomyces sp. SAS_275 TaxID=3412746 RepID=UPI00403D14AC
MRRLSDPLVPLTEEKVNKWPAVGTAVAASSLCATPVNRHMGQSGAGHPRSRPYEDGLLRVAAFARDQPEPSVFVGLQMRGASVVAEHGRRMVLQAGDVVLVETDARPVTSADEPRGRSGQVTAVKLGQEHPVADLTEHYVRRLAAQPAEEGGEGPFARAGLEVLRAAISAHLQGNRDARETLQATLTARILRYVRQNLGDPQLSAGKIAAEQHISVRYLYKLLAGEGISLTSWIRTQRLEECSRELRAPSALNVTIETVAREWGFVDMSNFSRVFKAAYGVSPRQWRKQHVEAHRPTLTHAAAAHRSVQKVHAPLSSLESPPGGETC